MQNNEDLCEWMEEQKARRDAGIIEEDEYDNEYDEWVVEELMAAGYSRLPFTLSKRRNRRRRKQRRLIGHEENLRHRRTCL